MPTSRVANAAQPAPGLAAPSERVERVERGAWQAYRIDHRAERIRLLQKLCDERTPVQLYPLHANPDLTPIQGAVPARLCSLDSSHNGLHWRLPAQHPGLDGLLQSGACEAVALQDRVKLQFTLRSPLLVRGDANCMLQASLPDEIYRFQRRDSFRVTPPERLAPTVRFRHPAMPEMQLALRLLDISLGGCALWQPADVPALQAGTELAEVLVELDSLSSFKTRLTLQHVSPQVRAQIRANPEDNPKPHGLRLGCAWLPLAGAAERTLQRWIDQSQKRQRLLAQGPDCA